MEKKPYPSETQERFIIRLPDGLRDRIAEAAKAANRSMNAEFVLRLEQSFDAAAEDSDKRLEDSLLLNALRDVVGEIAKGDSDREEGVRAIGQDLHALCSRALPVIDDDERFRSFVQMLGDVGVSLQAGDIADAQGRLKAIYYLASNYALGMEIPAIQEAGLIAGQEPQKKKPRK
jgi:hypothetical protein